MALTSKENPVGMTDIVVIRNSNKNPVGMTDIIVADKMEESIQKSLQKAEALR